SLDRPARFQNDDLSHFLGNPAYAHGPIQIPIRIPAGSISALKRLPEIRRRRRQEKRLSKRSDRALFDIFRTLAERKDVFAYDNTDELRRFTDKSNPVPAEE